MSANYRPMTLFGGPGWLSALEVALSVTFIVFRPCHKSRPAWWKSRFGLQQIETGLPQIDTRPAANWDPACQKLILTCLKSRSACWKSRFGLPEIETGLLEIENRPAANRDRPAANQDRSLNKVSIAAGRYSLFRKVVRITLECKCRCNKVRKLDIRINTFSEYRPDKYRKTGIISFKCPLSG